MDSINAHMLPFHQSKKDRIVTLKYVDSLMKAVQNFPAQGKAKLTIDMPNKSVAVLRPLSFNEITTLESCGCQCDDWLSVYVMFCGTGEDVSDVLVTEALKSQVRNCSFSGKVVLGLDISISSKQNKSTDILKPGIQSNTVIANSIIEPGAKVYNNAIISNTFVGYSATILNCGSLTYEYEPSKESFNDLMTVNVGPEAGGGRPVNVMPESTLVDVCSSLLMSRTATSKTITHTQMDDDSTSTDIPFNVVCGDLLHTSVARNIYIALGAIIISSSSVQNAILLPQSRIQNSIADSVFLQWKSAIVNNSNVSSTMLMECSEIGPNSVVASTILGPDSHVSCGEVHCSVIGPNTNSHHQSLLISVLWPTGRGNVGYGSNIGSNHTGRIPDQECTVGEGVFWGLGCIIKFPVDLSRSFYSVVAAGVQLPPQSVAMPFSLIMAGGQGGQDMNEIVPGWLLQSSPYTILRSEEKFKSRRKAKRHDFYCGWKIIRPTTVDACIKARNVLLSAKSSGMNTGESSDSNAIFTEKDILQLGKNYMTTRGLNVGINAYTDIIQRYALVGLFEQLRNRASIDTLEQLYTNVAMSKNGDITKENEISWPRLPWEEESHNSSAKLLKHKLYVLSLEISSILGGDTSKISFAEVCTKCLKKLIDVEKHHAKQVLKSKQRDDKRGRQTIPDYAGAHVKAEDDPVVLLAQMHAKAVVSECNDIILSLFDRTSRL